MKKKKDTSHKFSPNYRFLPDLGCVYVLLLLVIATDRMALWEVYRISAILDLLPKILISCDS